MIKLKYDYHAEVDITPYFTWGGWLTKLIPFTNGRAVAFGVGYKNGGSIREEGYWLAEVKREGTTYRILPQELTEQLNTLFSRADITGAHEMKIQAFKFGEQFGLLIGSQFVYLFDDIHADPRMIEIANHFTLISEKRGGHFIPQRCGNPTGSLIPVMFSAPHDNLSGARHLSLLEIDEQAGKAKWLHTQADGCPRCTNIEEYVPFSNRLGADRPPIIFDCAWLDSSWFLFVAGFDHVYPRAGVSPSIFTRNSIDLGLLDTVFQPVDESLAHICISMDSMIISPYRKNGSRKGKQSIYNFKEAVEHELSMPRGYTKFSLLEYYDQSYWLTTNAMGYNGMQFDVVVCGV